MAVDSQIPQEASGKGRVKCTPLQGTEYANRCTPKPKYNNLEEWFQEVSSADHSFPFASGNRVSVDANNRIAFFFFCRILSQRLLVRRKTSRLSGRFTPFEKLREAMWKFGMPMCSLGSTRVSLSGLRKCSLPMLRSR